MNQKKKYSHSYEHDHPAKSLYKIGKNYLVYNWGLIITWILILILGSFYARHLSSSTTTTSSEIVTSVGLCQLVNAIIFAISTGIAVASSTFFVKRIGKKHLETSKSWFGSLLVILILIAIFEVLFIVLVGKYIVFLQNPNLPINYQNIIEHFLYFCAGAVPFIILFVIYTAHLSAEGHTGILVITGVTTNIVFIVFAEILFSSGAFNYIKNRSLEIIYILGTSYVISNAITALVTLVIGKYLYKKGNTYFDLNFYSLKYFHKERFKKIIITGSTLFIRTFAVIMGLILVNIILNYIPIPKGSIKGNDNRITNATYWQYITSVVSLLFSFALRGLYAIGGGSTRYIMSYNVSTKNIKKLLLTFRTSVFFTFTYLLIMEIILLTATGPILTLFGIENNAPYIYFDNNVHHTIIATHLLDQAIIITRLSIGGLVFLCLQPILTSYSFATRKTKLTYFIFCLDKLILEVPLFTAFAFISKDTNNFQWAWASYLISDFLSFWIIGFFLFHYYRKIKNSQNPNPKLSFKKKKLM